MIWASRASGTTNPPGTTYPIVMTIWGTVVCGVPPYTWTFDWGDGSAPTVMTGAIVTATHTYTGCDLGDPIGMRPALSWKATDSSSPPSTGSDGGTDIFAADTFMGLYVVHV